MKGFSGSVGVATNLFVELLALLNGLRLAWDLNIRNIVCCPDSMDVVQMISKGIPSTHYYSNLVYSTEDWFNREWNISLDHTLREGNSCADFLPRWEPLSPVVSKHGAFLPQEWSSC